MIVPSNRATPEDASFAGELLRTAFPFWFSLDAQDRIVAHGTSLGRWHGAELAGTPVGRWFEITSPRNGRLSFESIIGRLHHFVILDSMRADGRTLRLRGQFVFDRAEGTAKFIGSPWVADTAMLDELGLSFADFAVHDPVVDYLLVLQTQRQAVDDVQRLADEVQALEAERAKAVTWALELSESRVNLLINQLPAIVFTANAELRYTSMRGAAIARLGVVPEEMIGNTIPEFFGLTDPEHPQLRALCGALAGTPGNYETFVRGRYFRVHVEPQRDEAGAVVGVIGVALDISDQKVAMQALERSQMNLDEAQELAGLGSYEYELPSNAVRWSENCYRLLGVARDVMPLDTEQWQARIVADDVTRYRAAVERSRTTGEPFVVDHRVLRFDGVTRWVHHRGEFQYDQSGAPIRLNGTVLDITERKLAEDRLAFLAHHDELTGLPNRALFLDRLGQGIAQAERRGTMLAVLFVDLDRFKTVNDTAGHAAGDALLRDVAQRMQTCLREGDTLSRLGGDEFAAVLGDIRHADDAILAARRLIEALAQPLDGQTSPPAAASIGISVFPHDGADAEMLLRRADTAMYTAKESGGKSFQLYAPAMHDAAVERLILEHNLRVAIENDELFLEYQPIVNMDAEMVMVEALVRWNHPRQGVVPPLAFIPVAEDSGLIVALGEWVLRTACWQLVRWHAEGMTKLRLAVNASARQFADDRFAEMVGAVLAETGLEGRFLEIEVTESAFMQDMERAVALMAEIKSLGVSISVDDFGTGYSSLAYLQRLPVDSLKIDRSFVSVLDGEGARESQHAFARAIVTLGRTLDLRVIAEGVESADQADSLRALGCDEMQGFYFSRPVAASDLSIAARSAQR